MNTIGIDVGACALRIAAAKKGSVETLALGEFRDRLRVGYEEPASKEGDGGFRIASLKSVLDFERPFPPSSRAQTSVDALIALLGIVRAQVPRRGYGGDLRCVLAAPLCSFQRHRSALRTSAFRAGFPRVRIVDDTLAILLDLEPSVDITLVLSWGGSDCSVGLYRRSQGGYRVLAQGGGRDEGGNHLDAAIGAAMLAGLGEREDLLPGAASAELLRRVLAEAEAARPVLAAGKPISVPCERLLGEPARASSGFEIAVEPSVVEARLERMTGVTLRLVDEVLASARGVRLGMAVIAGGMARLASVRRRLEARLGPSVRDADDDSVARGAVRYGLGLPEDLWRAAAAPEAEAVVAPVKPVRRAYREGKRRRDRTARRNQRAETVGRSRKVGRNELCPCGSGRKYKRCCGA